MKRRMMSYILCILLLLYAGITGCSNFDIPDNARVESGSYSDATAVVPDYSGKPYDVINDNIPEFDEEDYTTEPFERYSELDSLGRCRVAFANVCREIMPTEKRGDIGMIKPAGWHTVKYDIIDGMYLYNRCHLIGYQLSGENANEKNLITGTRYMNTQGMLVFEDMVDDYVDATDNHVLYRVTPVYDGDNLVADGVQMEGWSVEDNGEGICFNVFVYNVQPGIDIDYATGESSLAEGVTSDRTVSDDGYVLNTNTKKFHNTGCTSIEDIAPTNKEISYEDKQTLINRGYKPCGRCKP